MTRTRSAAVLVAAVLVTAFSLRTAVASVGVLLSELRADLALSPALAGVLTSLPVLCFAALGPFAPRMAARIGLDRLLVLGFAAVTVGTALRPFTGQAGFTACSLLAYAGCAVVNVLLPGLIGRDFPGRVPLLTAGYSTAIAVGVGLASLVTVPIADGGAMWRLGLVVWAVPAAAATLLLALRPTPRVLRGPEEAAPPRVPRRAALLGALPLAVYFGTQGLQSYVAIGWMPLFLRSAGLSAEQAGALVALLLITAVPVSLVVPLLARGPHLLTTVLVLAAAYAAGYVGLATAPVPGAVVWMLLIGTGAGAFPLALAVIGGWSRHATATAGFSAAVQSIGYLIAAPGPVLVGVASAAVGTRTALLTVLGVTWVVHAAAGVTTAIVVRRRTAADAAGARSSSRPPGDLRRGSARDGGSRWRDARPCPPKPR
ncbi:MFS transporter [Amnibacterium kyonggiense]|uniref:CP family cyanate transporter-like MFS transporter n=1 Tax=Amnibacterium kyonggiense TaxID=595671 RepID=A0A4R7FM69_9MICO|nr:MFS transporter [Amnibacterium kyonggiense]TDS77541.1 CP family cyanate transporter-like MFS transporter [Amnibacterium kyonggiense]